MYLVLMDTTFLACQEFLSSFDDVDYSSTASVVPTLELWSS